MCECAWYYRGVNCRFIIYGAIPHVCALKRDRTPQNEPPANELPAKGSQVSGLRKVSEKRETLSPKTSKSQNSRRFEGSGIRNSEHSREIQNPPPPSKKKKSTTATVESLRAFRSHSKFKETLNFYVAYILVLLFLPDFRLLA